MELFTKLGALIESRWRDQNYNEDLFPEIAARSLSEFELPERTDPWQIISWIHTTPNLPEQMDPDAGFGDPPITLYVGPRFYIDVYYWLDGTTSIHQHSFSGAFQLLMGSSVHSRYRFENHQEINPRFLVGDIVLNDVSLLRKGDIREIIAGPQLIHSLFHLDRPSATITVRTYKAPSSSVQYSYRKPFIAFDPFFKDQLVTKQVQTVGLLLGMKHPEADGMIARLLDSSDFQATYAILERAFAVLCHRELENLFGVSRSTERFQALLNRARARHGELADRVLPVLEEKWRQNEIARRRDQIKGEDHRFFLALLLNVPDRGTILRLVKERFPDRDAIDLVVNWVRELAATKIFGSHEPNVLGIGEFDEGHLFVLKELLEGYTPDQINIRMAEEPSRTAKLNSTIQELATHIQSLPLLKSLSG
ncbi:MAG: hypothetical protein ACMG6H_06150 [Acidobacteriota bacterium]